MHFALIVVSRHMMKRFFILILVYFLKNTLLAQTDVQFSKDSDTTFWYQYKNDNARRFKLGFIENDTPAYAFRFWSLGLVIKVAGNMENSYGEIVRFVEAYSNNNDDKVFTKRYPISRSQASQLRHLIDSLQIEALPSDKNINGWQHGFDGIEYFTEFKRDGQYSFKNYWSPTAQDTLGEAMQFHKFVLGLNSILDLKVNSKEFLDSIPFDSWKDPVSGTNVIRLKPKTKRKNGG